MTSARIYHLVSPRHKSLPLQPGKGGGAGACFNKHDGLSVVFIETPPGHHAMGLPFPSFVILMTFSTVFLCSQTFISFTEPLEGFLGAYLF